MKKIVLLAIACAFVFACERQIPPSMRTAEDLSDRAKTGRERNAEGGYPRDGCA